MHCEMNLFLYLICQIFAQNIARIDFFFQCFVSSTLGQNVSFCREIQLFDAVLGVIIKKAQKLKYVRKLIVVKIDFWTKIRHFE